MKKLFNNVFNGKTVLITGHTGFKGSWLSIWLRELGADVIGYALEPYTRKDNFVVTRLKDKITSIIGDIRDYKYLLEIFKKFKPDIVFHLAAQPLVLLSYKEPKETYDVNIGGTVNILEAIRHTDSVKAAVIVTSDKCYENREWIWGYRENDRLGGYDVYSSSKGCSELVATSYRNCFFNPADFKKHKKIISTVRAGNVIGGGDWRTSRIMPDCIRALKKGSPIVIRNPDSVRPWQHVLEPIGGYLLLASKMMCEGVEYSGAWNFGPKYSSMKAVSELTSRLIEFWRGGKWEIAEEIADYNKHHEAVLLTLDISKALNILAWVPILDFDETLSLTVDWYKKSNPGFFFDVTQIKEYVSVAEKKGIKWME